MSLRKLIDRAVGTAFRAIGDIPVPINYISITSGVYDPVTGQTVTTKISYPIDAVLEDYLISEIDNEAIKLGDKKALIRQSSLNRQSTLPIIPKTTDIVNDGIKDWDVISIGQDPASATWVLQLRRK